ncbi:uridylate-specific endoribonuclease C-like [Ictalurus furcatus]|uniref:uridylate-specific endoribonuclease C-like n=1 Tax=Ictalurus furcatus TaxID=66913 RepID=UPI0023508AE1|nr:uridylate-specific endoribonuclease C-like [Ictalurus furcatus]
MARHPAVDQELSAILNELWKLDVNCVKPGKDYTINLQSEADYVACGKNHARDKANAPLFTYVNEDKLKSIATYASFISLLDNYEMSTGVAEKVTSEELEENNIFLNAILQTQVMKRAHGYLVNKGKASSDVAQFKKQLFDIWFKLYHRGRSGGENSCGFEHVFVGETKHGEKIMGLHNWVQFYLQEKLNCIDYKGYTASHKDRPDVNDRVISLQFSWKGLLKPLGSSFIGVSPEFEVALYTIIFLNRNEQVSNTVVNVDKYLLEVVVCRQGHAIGTSYPKLLDKTLGACSFSTDQSKKI